jgi:exonuclease SbcD
MGLIVHSGDFHCSNRGTVGGRYVLKDGINLNLLDRIKALGRICEFVEENEVDLVVIAGDVFDSSSPENVAIRVVVEAVERLSERAPTVIVKGNHDGSKGTEKASALSIFGQITRRFGIYVSERPEIIPIVSNGRKIQVFTLPYPRKSAVATNPEYKNLSPEELARLIGFKLEEIVSSFTAQIDRDALNIIAGHLSIAGGIASKEQIVPPFDISIREEFLEKFDLVCFGHLHVPQKYYCGTIARSGFGEEDMKVGFKVYEFKDKEFKEEFIELPARRYKTIEAYAFLSDAGALEGVDNETVIRIKGRVKRWELEEIQRRIRALNFQYVLNNVEVDDESVRIEGKEIDEEPDIEEAIKLWVSNKDGVSHYLGKLIETAKEVESKWLSIRI